MTFSAFDKIDPGLIYIRTVAGEAKQIYMSIL